MTDQHNFDNFQERARHACTLVGTFMYHWALLETGVNEAVKNLLGLERLAGTVVVANLTFGSKMHIVQTMVDLKASKADWKAAAQKELREISDLSYTRNMIAHTSFGPDDKGEGAVRFLTVKASGKLKFPNEVWTEENFRATNADLKRLRTRLEQIVADMLPARDLTLHDLVASMRLTPEAEPTS